MSQRDNYKFGKVWIVADNDDCWLQVILPDGAKCIRSLQNHYDESDVLRAGYDPLEAWEWLKTREILHVVVSSIWGLDESPMHRRESDKPGENRSHEWQYKLEKKLVINLMRYLRKGGKGDDNIYALADAILKGANRNYLSNLRKAIDEAIRGGNVEAKEYLRKHFSLPIRCQ